MELTISFGLITLALMAWFVPVRGKSLIQHLTSSFSVATTTVLGTDPVPKSKRVTALVAVAFLSAAFAFAAITNPVAATVTMVAAFAAAWAVTLARSDTVRFYIARLAILGAHPNDPAHRPRDYTSIINSITMATMLTGLGAALIRLVTVGDPLAVFVSVTLGFAAVFRLVINCVDVLEDRGIIGGNTAHAATNRSRAGHNPARGFLVDIGTFAYDSRFGRHQQVLLAGDNDDGLKRTTAEQATLSLNASTSGGSDSGAKRTTRPTNTTRGRPSPVFRVSRA